MNGILHAFNVLATLQDKRHQTSVSASRHQPFAPHERSYETDDARRLEESSHETSYVAARKRTCNGGAGPLSSVTYAR
jgi:hypothetical protein